MAYDPRLTQRGFTVSYDVQLLADRIKTKGDLVTSGREVAFRHIQAILKDSEKVYVVGPTSQLEFLNQPGKADFTMFLDELLRRVVATTTE